jgi:hypothetical protein
MPTTNNPQIYTRDGVQTSYTLSNYTVPNVANRILVVTFHSLNTGGTPPQSVTFNGTPLTLGVASYSTSIWYLLNPTVTTANIVATTTGTSQPNTRGAVTALTLSDAQQQGPSVTNHVEAAGTSVTTSLTTTYNNHLVLDAYTAGYSATPSILQGPNQVAVYAQRWGSGTQLGVSYRQATTAQSVSLGWNQGGNDQYRHALAAFAGINCSPPLDSTPDAFNFTDQTGVATNTTITSNSVTISGINTPAAVTATNGATFSINGGAYGTSGNISNGQTLTVRMTSSASASTAVSTTVTVGGVSDNWSVTTASACGGSSVGGFCWYVGASNQSCNTVCTSRGGVNLSGTRDYAGSGGSDANCINVRDALGLSGITFAPDGSSSSYVVGLGCAVSFNNSSSTRVIDVTTNATDANSLFKRVCACNN